MKTWLQQLADKLSTSFWFLPTLMACTAAALAGAMLFIDLHFTGISWPDWLKVGSVESIRELLSSLVGSIITVLGVVFSITIVALTLAASQLGPRILRNFMRDRINQTTLGVFVATYIYCLIVLFAVGRFTPADEQLPQISTIGAFLLSIASLAMLIYFIHHLAQSIQAPHVLMVIASELHAVIDRTLPDNLDQPKSSAPDHAHPADGSPDADRLAHDADTWNDASSCNAADTGYIQAVDLESLIDTAVKHDLKFRLLLRPGDFVARDEPIISILPPQQLSDEIRRSITHDIYIGSQRTATQDLEFVMQELVEVGLRAISPSINDPFTAINAVDYLGEALRRITRRHMPPETLCDSHGAVRIVIDRPDFDGLCDVAFNQIRQHAVTYPDVLIRILENINRAARETTLPKRKQTLYRHARMILTLGTSFPEPYDRQALTDRFNLLHQTLLPESDTYQALPPT